MNRFFRSCPRLRACFSRLGSLLLLFQRTPLIQFFFPEARIIGAAGLGEITAWTVTTVAGLGAYDSVAGATAVTQFYPTPNSLTVSGTAGTALGFTAELTGALPPTGIPASWSVTPAPSSPTLLTLPFGLTHENAVNNSRDSIYGTPLMPGTFKFQVTAYREANYKGDSSSTTFTMTIAAVPGGAIPSISTNPVSTTINSGGSTTLTVAATGSPAPSYQWYSGTAGNTTKPVGTNSNSFTTPALTATTRYWVLVYNTAGSANSTAATVTVNTPPVFTTQPASVTINSGTSTQLTSAATGTPAPTFQWYTGTSGVTTNPISGATSATYTTPLLTNNTSYWVRASNSAGATDSNTATVSVNQPAAIATAPASVQINSGATATLNVVASGTPPFTYQWYEGTSGTTTTPVGTDSSSFTTPALAATTSYWVKVTNSANPSGASSAAATVTVASADPFTAWQGSQFSQAQLADALISGPTADPDGDGISNRDEFVFGLQPLTREAQPGSTPVIAGNQLSINFTAKAASGAGYSGKTRHYSVQSNNTLSSTWTDVPGYTDIVGGDQAVSFTTTATPPATFYRLRAWLTP